MTSKTSINTSATDYGSTSILFIMIPNYRNFASKQFSFEI